MFDFLPDYSRRPIQRNPYFLGGVGFMLAGAALHWWSVRADNIAEELGVGESALVTPDGSGLSLLTSDLTAAQAEAFKRSLPSVGQQYAPLMVRAGKQEGVSPFVIAGIMANESGFGTVCKMPACQGYDRHGWGLMQIDDRSHKPFIASKVNGRPAYEDPWSSIEYGADLFRRYREYLARRFPNLSQLELLRATTSAYNAGNGAVGRALAKGRNPDSVTTGRNYGKKVLASATGYLTAARGMT